jgi:hypothetical protein
VPWKRDFQQFAAQRAYFAELNPFGDFDLVFGATKMVLKIVDMPIRYRERVYGTTIIQQWRFGWLLVKIVIFAARRLMFV